MRKHAEHSHERCAACAPTRPTAAAPTLAGWAAVATPVLPMCGAARVEPGTFRVARWGVLVDTAGLVAAPVCEVAVPIPGSAGSAGSVAPSPPSPSTHACEGIDECIRVCRGWEPGLVRLVRL